MKLNRRIISSILTVAIMCGLTFAGCNDKNNNSSSGETPTYKLTLDKTEISIISGVAEIITATTDFDGEVIFSAENSGIISVRSAGLAATVTGKKVGETNLIATAGDVKAKCKITVTQKDSLRLNFNNMTLEDSKQSTLPNLLKATFTSSNGTDTPTFKSDNENIVKVVESLNGVATLEGVAVGKATVTATIGDATSDCVVEVCNYGFNVDYFLTTTSLAINGLKLGNTINGEVYIPNIYWFNNLYVPVIATGENAFKDMSTITKAHIGQNVMCISKGTFQNTSIEFVDFHKDPIVQTISDYAFANTKISEIEIFYNKNGHYIGKYCFSDCVNLTKVTLPDDMIKISEGTFYNCAKLEKIFIPANVTAIQPRAFSGDTEANWAKLTNIYYGGGTAQWTVLMNVVENENGFLKTIQSDSIRFGATAIA